MRELDAQYPQYGFAKNKGYGTAQHIAALRQYGPMARRTGARLSDTLCLCEENAMKEDAYLQGRLGELRAEQHVVALGYEILEHNAVFPGAEIDLIARDGECTVFY